MGISQQFSSLSLTCPLKICVECVPQDVTMLGLSLARIGVFYQFLILIGHDPGDVMSLSRVGKCHQNMKLESLVTKNSMDADIRYSSDGDKRIGYL